MSNTVISVQGSDMELGNLTEWSAAFAPIAEIVDGDRFETHLILATYSSDDVPTQVFTACGQMLGNVAYAGTGRVAEVDCEQCHQTR